MPRSQTVTVNGKQVTVKEKTVRELREEVIPQITNALKMDDLAGKEITDVVSLLTEKVAEFFPELTPADVDNAYPSEIEALVEAWINVNFTGVKKIYAPVLRLTQLGSAK